MSPNNRISFCIQEHSSFAASGLKAKKIRPPPLPGELVEQDGWCDRWTTLGGG